MTSDNNSRIGIFENTSKDRYGGIVEPKFSIDNFLTDGECDEIIAKFVEAQPTGYSISRPCTVIPSPQGMGLVPSLFCGELNNNITLKLTRLRHEPIKRFGKKIDIINK